MSCELSLLLCSGRSWRSFTTYWRPSWRWTVPYSMNSQPLTSRTASGKEIWTLMGWLIDGQTVTSGCWCAVRRRRRRSGRSCGRSWRTWSWSEALGATRSSQLNEDSAALPNRPSPRPLSPLSDSPCLHPDPDSPPSHQPCLPRAPRNPR